MKIEKNISLRELVAFRVGGKAKFFVKVTSSNDLIEVAKYAKSQNLPIFILGHGSNILVSEKGFSGLVIQMALGGINYKSEADTFTGAEKIYVSAGAGVSWDDLVKNTVQAGFFGLENLSGIPGTVGAAPVQNIGAYGAEVKDSIVSLEVFDTGTLKSRKMTNAECQFGYRESIFKRKENSHLVITEVTFELKKEGPVNISYSGLEKFFLDKEGNKRAVSSVTALEVRNAILSVRKEKLPDFKKVGTAGSFFKNPIVSNEKFLELKARFPEMPGHPVDEQKKGTKKEAAEEKVKIPAAWLIDKVCGLKDYREGDVGTWPNQPLVIVNYGGASAHEVTDLARKIEASVKEKTGIGLEWEVQSVY